MPRAYDQRQLVIDRNPLNQLPVDYGKLPKLDPIDPADLLHTYITSIERITGIDLSGAEAFLDSIKTTVGMMLAGFGTAWNGLIDGITGVWTGITDTVGKAWTDAVEAISGIFGRANSAKLSADNANIGVEKLRAQLSGGGWDEFDYESANTLPSSLYEVSSSGPGAGYYGPQGTGYLEWKPSGGNTREIVYRRTDTSLSEDNGVVTVVWAWTPYKVLLGPQTYGYICGRMSLVSNNTYVRARIGFDKAAIDAVVSGTATQIGSTANITTSNGDVFELWMGDTTPGDEHPRRFKLKQNGVTVLTVEDGAPDGTGSVSEMGSGYRQCGIGCKVENYLVFFQNPAPTLAGWTWALQPTGGS